MGRLAAILVRLYPRWFWISGALLGYLGCQSASLRFAALGQRDAAASVESAIMGVAWWWLYAMAWTAVRGGWMGARWALRRARRP